MIVMLNPSPLVDQFDTTNDIESIPWMKILSNNVRFHPNLAVYPDELKMMIQSLNDFVLAYALYYSFVVPI